MSESCPHCGARIPSVGDAFCPECRKALDEQPTAGNGKSATDASDHISWRGWVSTLAIFGGAGVLVSAFVALMHNDWIEAAYTGIGGIVFLVIAVVLMRKSCAD